MAWQAKPSGRYDINSTEAAANMFEMKDYFSSQGWTDVAIAGMLGNVCAESGFNPWRWQNDVVSWASDQGYGLFQFTPQTYYIGGRGTNFPAYSPNTSTSIVVAGATPNDGLAQCQVVETYHNDKFLDRRNRCTYADLTNTYPYSSYKQLNDLWIATVGWLFNYEYPASRGQTVAETRYAFSTRCYEIITGSEPPTPPVPPHPTRLRKMPVWMMTRPLRY